MSKTCLYIVIGLILGSSGYLAYMNIVRQFSVWSHVRYWIFFGQHILLASYLIWNQRFTARDQVGNKLKGLLIFSGINFCAFVGFQIYGASSVQGQAQFFGDPSKDGQDFSNGTYFHLYYQYNIYNGVFCIFCLIMIIFYEIHRRNQERDFEEVVQGLERCKQQANTVEDPCCICLVQFEKGQECLKLQCSHIFHSECLTHWMKQHMTCPMCRDNIRDRILHRNRELIQAQDS